METNGVEWKEGGCDLMDEAAHNSHLKPRACVSPAVGWAPDADAGMVVVLLAGIDTVGLSTQARVSEAVYGKLAEAKASARLAEAAGAVHCPDWLGAQVKPTGARGGYPYLLETDDFAVKVAGPHQTTWPGICAELRAHFLHAHALGSRGACEEALCWIREQLLYDRDEAERQRVRFETVSVSRADIHIDWQGGWAPSFTDGEERRFIRPRNAHWHPFLVGNRCQGYRFGTGNPVMARIYDKTAERAKRADEGYAALLRERHGERFDPTKTVWRLEFELHREAIASLKLAPESDAEDDDADVEAELSAEDLPHVGTLPRLFAHLDAIFQHLSYHWLRLVISSSGSVRSRWPLDPTWTTLRAEFGRVAGVAPLPPDALAVVRGARWAGRSRLLNRMAAGVLASLDVVDAEVAHASLRRLREVMEKRAAREAERLARRRGRLLARLDHADGLEGLSEDELRERLAEIDGGKGLSVERAEVIRHRLQMLLGIWAAKGIFPLDITPIENVSSLYWQHAEDLERLAKEVGGAPALLQKHYQKTFKVAAPLRLFSAQYNSRPAGQVIAEGEGTCC